MKSTGDTTPGGTASGQASAPLDPVKALNALGALWSDDLDAYAAGRIDASEITCVLCQCSPCRCPEFGSEEYLRLLDVRHSRTRISRTHKPGSAGAVSESGGISRTAAHPSGPSITRGPGVSPVTPGSRVFHVKPWIIPACAAAQFAVIYRTSVFGLMPAPMTYAQTWKHSNAYLTRAIIRSLAANTLEVSSLALLVFALVVCVARSAPARRLTHRLVTISPAETAKENRP